VSRFLVELRGTNFLLNIDGEHVRFGFTATRLIKANSEAEAERIALIRIHQQLNQSNDIVQGMQKSPKIAVVRCKKLRLLHFSGGFDKRGLNFFPEDSSCE